MDDRDIFSYEHSDHVDENSDEVFDLNAFSSVPQSEEITLEGLQEEADERSVPAGKKADKKKKKKNRSTKQKILRGVLTVFLIGLITVSLIVSAFLFYAFTMVDGTMDYDLDNLELNFTTTIYLKDAEGNYKEYKRLHGEFNRIWVSYDEKAAKAKEEGYKGIPQNLVNAFVAIEDKRFFEHNGVDWKRTFSAFANLFFHFYSSNQGGSTITQQLVKNLTNDNSQKPSRKIREIMRARYFENKYAKSTIMECYLNTIAMGHGMYGMEVASNYYFGKSVGDLSLAQCACLAAITKSPSTLSPDDNPENNKARREAVLYQMKDQGYITEAEYEEALKEEIVTVGNEDARKEQDDNSYFVDALIDQVIDDLCQKYGYDTAYASKLFYSGGFRIYATLDTNIQNAIDTVFTDEKSYALKAANGKTMQGAITVMDYEGHVLGMAGGIGKKAGNRVLNRATSSPRQPGSTIKPLAAYAPAIEKNMIHYSSIVNDTRVNYGNWTPHNWYGGYWGNITVQYALERSVNTIPVYLVNKMTPQVSFDFLEQKLGVTTLVSPKEDTKNKIGDMNLSALGMGGMNWGLTTTESAAAYAVFGNKGRYYKPTLYTKVTDQYGNIILEYSGKSSMAVSEDTATVMNKLLQQVVYGAKGTGTGAKDYIKNMRIYAKTGTSNDTNDLWFVGGSPYYVASCWCGYDEKQDIPNQRIAMTMWGAVMSKIHNGLEAKEFPTSAYAAERYYCTASGELATANCPSRAVGYYRKSNTPGICHLHGGEALPDPKTVAEQEKKAEEQKKAEEEKKKAETGSDQTSKPENASAPAGTDNGADGNGTASE